MSLDNLPVEWFETTLDQIAEWGSGGTPSRKNSSYYGGDVPWIKTGDLGEKYVTQATEFITDEAVKNSSAKYFKKGSVIMAMYGATIGKTSILGIDATTNQACAVGTPIATSTEFLYYFLRNEKDSFIAKGKGGAQPNISQQIIKAHTIYLPSLAEQQEIVRQLDFMLAQVEQIKARLDAIPAILKKFRQSVLADAVSGRLVEKNHSIWVEKNLSELTLKITDGEHLTPPIVESGVPLLSAKDVHEQYIDFSNCKYIERSIADKALSRCNPQYHDLLVVSRGATVGRTHYLKNSREFCLMGSVLLIRANMALIQPAYLDIFFKSELGRKQLISSSGASAQQAIYIRDVKKMKVSYPSIEVQEDIIVQVNTLFKFIEKIEFTVQSAQKRVNLLTQSILAKAFSGELTAEWREQHQDLITGINSAESLLAKIQAEREANKPVKKTRVKKEA